MRVFFWLCLSSVAALAGLSPLRARADEPARWLFVPVISQQRELPAWIASALDELAHSAEAKGIAVWSRDEASQLFERKHSSELSPITPDDTETLERLSDSAVKSMASQHHAAALHELDAADRLYQRAPEEFNRLAPRQVLDMCLFRARALVETGQPLLKVKQGIRDCRLRIPLEIEPNLLTHTNPTIRKLVAEVSSELSTERSGRLLVRGQAGCPVRMDGVEVGRLRGGQLQFDNLLVGTHRISVACEGAHTRIYAVTVTGAEAAIGIDDQLDASLRSRPYLHLDVEPAMPQARVSRLGRIIGDVLKSTSVVLARVTPGGPVVLRLLTPLGEVIDAQLAAPAQIGEAWTPEQRDAAIEALLHPPVAAPVVAAAVAPPAPAPRRRGALSDRELKRWKRASYSLLGVAGASAVTWAALHFKARSIRDARRAEYDARSAVDFEGDEVARARRFGVASASLGVLQGALLGGALTGPLLDRMEHKKPNMALMISLSVIGAGLIGASVLPLMEARDACTECAARRDDASELGFMLAGVGMGLIAAPALVGLSYYLPTRSRSSLAVAPGRVTLRGTF